MKRFENFDRKGDFWKTFPELLVYPIFKDLHDNVKGSSEAMWAIHVCEHPKSLVFNDPDKYTLFKKELKPIQKDMAKISEAYRSRILSPAETQLLRWKENLDKINDYANSADFTKMKTSEAKHITEIMEKVQKLFSNYDSIQQLLREEENKTDSKKSLTQEGLI